MRLNLGSGDTPLANYENLDIKNGQSIYPLNYPDNSADEVRASHVLEHFPHHQTMDVLREWVRVLKPGGWLKVAVPDFDWIIGRYYYGKVIVPTGQNDPFTGSVCVVYSQEGDAMNISPIEGYLMGGQIDEWDEHKAIFSEWKLTSLFNAVGLAQIQKWESEIKDCASLPVSLNLMAQKPGVLNV